MQPGTSESLKPSTPANTSNAASNNGPWTRPELEKNPNQVLDVLRETKYMIANLQDREKRLKAEVQQLFDSGALASMVDENDPQKFHGDGVSVSICKGRKTRTYDSAVQMEIEVLQKQIDKVKYIADRKEQYEDTFAPSYWRVSIRDEVL
jgi:hypothetical protein